jgi:hypothetical protein
MRDSAAAVEGDTFECTVEFSQLPRYVLYDHGVTSSGT